MKILNKVFSNKINMSHAVPAIASNASDLSSFFNNNKIKFQDTSHSFTNYFKDAETTLNNIDVLKKNSYLSSTLLKNLPNYDNLDLKYNNLSENLLQYVNSSTNLIKHSNDSKISESIIEMRNATTNFIKIDLKKDIKKLVADSNNFIDSNRSLLSPIQISSILFSENKGLKRNEKLLPVLPSSTLQNQFKSPKFQKYEHNEENFKVANINDMKINHTNDLEKLMHETKNINDVFSATNINDNMDKSTNDKLNSLKIDIETILSTEVKKHSIQNNIPIESNTNTTNDIKNTDKYSNYKKSYDYSINTLKKDLEDLFLTELRKHGVI